ncbi:MAG: hypothetical protein KDB66_08090 [Solirubrobacterales bacterium]|nr:hypothetical protein [Solirubrobacterales bacterium]
MRNPLAIGAATLAIALSLGLAACGSSDDDTLSKSELITQADQICQDYNDKLVKIQEDSGLNNQSSNQEVVAFITDDIVPLFNDQIDELRALQPDDADADTYNEILDTLESEVKKVEDDPEAAVNQDDPFSDSSAKANDFGMKVCGGN